jgi:hypothetical protein
MTWAAIADTPQMHARGLPVIDPQSLSPAQRAGRRCAIPNCLRLLGGFVGPVGRLPSGETVLACSDCFPAVSYTGVHLDQLRSYGP